MALFNLKRLLHEVRLRNSPERIPVVLESRTEFVDVRIFVVNSWLSKEFIGRNGKESVGEILTQKDRCCQCQ